jgi:hypothetical protein
MNPGDRVTATPDEILKRAKEWVEMIDFTGKANLKEIRKELGKMRHGGRPVHVEVTDEPSEIPELIKKGTEALYGSKAKEQLSKIDLRDCIMSYYIMAKLDSVMPSYFGCDLFEACKHGLGFIIHLGPLVVGVTRPEAYTEEAPDGSRRVHREGGPAIAWRKTKLHYIHGEGVE